MDFDHKYLTLLKKKNLNQIQIGGVMPSVQSGRVAIYQMSNARGNGDCFYISILMAINNIKLIDSLIENCLTPLQITLDESMISSDEPLNSIENMFVKALRELCVKSPEFISEYNNLFTNYYSYLLSNNEELLGELLVNTLNKQTLGALNLILNREFYNGTCTIQIIESLNGNDIGTITYKYFDESLFNPKPGSIKLSKGLIDNMRVVCPKKDLFSERILQNTVYNKVNQSYATEIEIGFLKNKLLNCININLNFLPPGSNKLINLEPIDSRGRPNIYIKYGGEHWDPYLLYKSMPIGEESGDAGGGMPSAQSGLQGQAPIKVTKLPVAPGGGGGGGGSRNDTLDENERFILGLPTHILNYIKQNRGISEKGEFIQKIKIPKSKYSEIVKNKDDFEIIKRLIIMHYIEIIFT